MPTRTSARRRLRSCATSNKVMLSLSGFATASKVPSAFSAKGWDEVGPAKRVKGFWALAVDDLCQIAPAASSAVSKHTPTRVTFCITTLLHKVLLIVWTGLWPAKRSIEPLDPPSHKIPVNSQIRGQATQSLYSTQDCSPTHTSSQPE